MKLTESQVQKIGNLLLEHTMPQDQLGFTDLGWLVAKIVKIVEHGDR